MQDTKRDLDTWEWGETRRACMRMARRYSRDLSQVEDITQEALIRAWRHRGRLRGSDRRMAWLAMIVRNEAMRERSRRRPVPLGTIEPAEGVEDAALISVVDSSEIHAALRMLEPSERLVLHLRYSEDLTQPAIATRLRIPEGTVKVRLHRARVKLCRAIEGS